MSRKQATLAVLLAAVLVFGGTATTLGTSGGGGVASEAGDADVRSNAIGAVQETQNVTNTSVTFENQTSNGSAVTVAEANLTDGGFVVIHTAELLNGSVLDSVVGVSEYQEPGANENVTVELDEPVSDSQTLLAVAYQDTNDDQQFDFVETTGEQDGAYTEENQVVVDDAFVTVEEEPATPTETTTTPTETTEIPTTETPTTPETPTTTTTETTTTETPTATTTTKTTTTTETTTIETTTPTTVETTTPEETTTTPETTTTTEEPDERPPAEEFVFRIDNANVENVSFLVGDADEPDRVIFVENTEVSDETVELDLTEILREGELADSSDIGTVQFVLRDVEIENATVVVTAPEGVTPRLVRGPPADETTTTPADTTTTPDETTTTETTTETTTPDETTTTTTATTPDETTTTEQPAAVDSLRVSNLTAPSTLVLNEGKLVVNAQLSNPGDEAVTDTVELRVGGTVVETRQVEVGPGETEHVQFRVDRGTLDLETGDTFVGVLTRDFGQVKQVTVEETGQPDDEGEETTIDDEGEETTTEDETTTEAVDGDETTTEAADGDETTTEASDGDDTDAETDEDATDASLRVSGLDAPDSLVLDEGTLVVTAELENPTDATVTDTAELRIDGTVVAERQVEVEPGETREVQFEVNKQDLGLAPGETFLEVLTRDFGESITVTVEEK